MPKKSKPRKAKRVSVKAWGIWPNSRCKIPRVIYPQRFVTRGYMDWKAGEHEVVRPITISYTRAAGRGERVSQFETVSHVHRSAEISECGRYRWWLRRSWQLWNDMGEHVTGKGVCCFVMLNPSTADALQDDPTIRRCIDFARRWQYDTLVVRNLFAYRATDPKELLNPNVDVVGGNRAEIELTTALTANMVIAAWGAGAPFGRGERVLKLWRDTFPKKEIYCLGKTKNGHPRHPLYVAGSTRPELFNPPKASTP